MDHADRSETCLDNGIGASFVRWYVLPLNGSHPLEASGYHDIQTVLQHKGIT